MLYTFSVRLLVSSYAGPILNLRRSSDNATADFYTDATQSYLSTGINNTGTSFSSWIGAGTAYVTIWYDQSGKANHATQSSTTNQPTISLKTNNSVSKYVIYFNNSSTFQYVSLTTPQKPYTMFSQFNNSNSNFGSIFCALAGASDNEQRFNSGTDINGYGNGNDWYYTCSGTKYSYNNGVSSSSVVLNSWNSMALTSSSPVNGYSLRDIGTDGALVNRGMVGYMTEMLGHNTSMSTTDLTAFYTNRLF
jgi:hypothetical protein